MRKPQPQLTPDLLLHGYASGVFPMSEHRDDPEVFWVDPRRRGILPLDRFHISRSLARRMRAGGYKVALNTRFTEVLDGCADRPETWINGEIYRLYMELHEAGHAHSLEVFMDGALVGGVYGVTLGAAFFGESMFSRKADASKLALAHLTDHLLRCGFKLFDTQFITEHLASLGAIEISRAEYHSRLAEALSEDADINSVPLAESGQDVLQRRTQMS